MLVYSKTKGDLVIINSLTDLFKFIINYNIYTNILSFDNLSIESKESLIDIISENNKISCSQLKRKIKRLKIFNGTIRTAAYWYTRGYNTEESKQKVSEIQRNNSNKTKDKYTAEERRKFSVRCIEYWIDKGYTDFAAKQKVAEIQNNTSLNKMIKKYGPEEGAQKRQELTDRWQNILNSKSQEEKDLINSKKGSGGYKLKGRVKTLEQRMSLSASLKKYYETNDTWNKGINLREYMGDERYNLYISHNELKKGKIPWNKGRKSSEESKKKVSKANTGNTAWNKGLTRYTDPRIAEYSGKIKYIFVPNYNPNVIPIIEQYGKRHGYNFQHAENGGEYHIKGLGYWVDGYDKEKNVVIEIDEKGHFDSSGNLREKDVKRQQAIEEFLKCKFIRLNYEDYKNGNF